MYKTLALLLALAFASPLQAARTLDKNIGWPGETLAGSECLGEPQGFGPFDYNDPKASQKGGYGHLTGSNTQSPLYMVETAHFKPYVDRLEKGKNALDPGPDIDYTLRAFPNHRNALWAMVRYYLRETEKERLSDGKYSRVRGIPPPECYFYRAAVFAPEDPIPPFIFGIYLHKVGQLEMALRQYSRAEQALAKNSELIYNIGLLHYDMKNFELAREYAMKAEALGYPLKGLQRRLKSSEAESAKSVQ